MLVVEAFDPGVTTGYARALIADDRDDDFVVPVRLLEACPLLTNYDVFTMLRHSDADVRVIEDFIGAGHRTREAIYTLKLVGFLENLGLMSDDPLTVIQRPQQRKAFVRHATQLMEDGGFPKSVHAADALAHILSFQYATKRRE